jgi:dTDP-4-amino-4,6-dideoxygalactose transaminase
MSLLSPIHHTFAPHVTLSYALRSIGLLLMPWKWQRGRDREILRHSLSDALHGDVALFASGREALVALFKAMHLKAGEEVIVQSYTCVVVPNAIHAAGGVPVYAEIDRETLNLTAESVRECLTPRTRAVICQHTFGIPGPTAELRTLCAEKHLTLIEDCAHVLPDASGPAPIGAGDFLLLSFGRDKAISGITGGAIVSKQSAVSALLKGEEAKARGLSHLHIVRLLLYPLVYLVSRPLIGVGIGKAILQLARMIGALVPILTATEKQGQMSPALHALPNACAALTLGEWKKLQKINDHRRALTQFFLEEGKEQQWPMLSGVTGDLPLQKFPLFTMHAEEIRQKLKKQNIHLHDGWTGCVVCPEGVDFDPVNYVPGSDPVAEAACEQILSLPTHPTMTLGQGRSLVRALSEVLPSSPHADR